MKPAALCFWGVVVAMVIMSAQAAPTGDSERMDEQPPDFTEINLQAGLLGRACSGFECDLDCDFGYDKDADGCFVCRCLPDDKEGIYQGDIVVGLEGKNRILYGDENRGSVTYGKWPGGKIPYVIESSIGSRGRTAISQAIADYHKYTCLRFSPRTNQRNYISFYNGGGCFSPVGMNRNSYNRISLGSGCWDKGTVIHEIMHSLGFFHEQSRPDRDRYVTINSRNIQRGMGYNFNIQKNIDSLGTPYDLASAMHYSSTAFAVRGRTITTKDPNKQHLIDTYNRISGLSQIDIQQLNLRYQCGGGTGVVPTAAPPSCEDKDRRCSGWQGHCQSNAYVKKNCDKTCGTCGGTGVVPTAAPPSCVDQDTKNCPAWKRSGYCKPSSQYAAYMKQNCAKTCDMCG